MRIVIHFSEAFKAVPPEHRGLTKKMITDRRGHQRTVYVRAEESPATKRWRGTLRKGRMESQRLYVHPEPRPPAHEHKGGSYVALYWNDDHFKDDDGKKRMRGQIASVHHHDGPRRSLEW